MPKLIVLALTFAMLGACTPEKRPRTAETVDTELWKEFRGGAAVEPADEAELNKQLTAVQTLGYFDGVKPAEGAPESVTFVAPELAWPGYNFYISGGEPEARLIDMQGGLLHVWRKSLTDVPLSEDPKAGGYTPPFMAEPGANIADFDSWQGAELLPDGSVLALVKDVGVLKVDVDSNLVWHHVCMAHHNLTVSTDGRVFVLISDPRPLPRIHPTRPQLDDRILILTADGDAISSISIHDALANSPFEELLRQCPPSGDPFHTNSIQILEQIDDENLPPAFQPGAILVSIRELNAIGLIDPDSGVFTWIETGSWAAQHDARFTDRGTITLFDNYGYPTEFGESRVLEYDPSAGRIRWQYFGVADNHFSSSRRGNVQLLPNGNMLVNESDNGRAFEVTSEGRIAWEFVNPHRAGEDNRFIAVLRRFERIDPAFVGNWLER